MYVEKIINKRKEIQSEVSKPSEKTIKQTYRNIFSTVGDRNGWTVNKQIKTYDPTRQKISKYFGIHNKCK